MGEYIPQAPTDEEAKRYNQNLPGMGGLFNTVNANLYHYAGNNPVKYTDPDGRDIVQLLDLDRGRTTIPILDKISFGHSAALIGNDDDGWLYYSNDGPISIDVQWFSTKEVFFENYDKGRENPFSYIEGSYVKTDLEQDKAMQKKAFELAGINETEGFDAKMTGKRLPVTEETRPSPYRFLTNNCSQHVGQIAFAGGVFSTGDLIPKGQILMDKDTYLMYIIAQYMSIQEH